MKRFALAFAALSVAMVAPQVAQAASTITYIGTINSGATDATGAFGTSPLAGQKIKMIFTVDDLAGTYNSSSSASSASGSANSGFSITINNITKYFSANTFNSLTNGYPSGSGFDGAYSQAAADTRSITVAPNVTFTTYYANAVANVFSYASNILSDASLNSGTTYVLTGAESYAAGSFALFNVASLTGVAGDIAAGGTFQISQVSVGAVPEASTWFMMILGFGATGFALRRQRARQERFEPTFA
jgi:hypothetical protein